jgi:hypothetical protein
MSSEKMDYYKALSEQKGDKPRILDQILQNVSFDSMKEIPFVVKDENNKSQDLRINFFRKGVNGDWESHFSPHQMVRLESHMKRKAQEWGVDMTMFQPIWNYWFHLDSESEEESI